MNARCATANFSLNFVTLLIQHKFLLAPVFQKRCEVACVSAELSVVVDVLLTEENQLGLVPGAWMILWNKES